MTRIPPSSPFPGGSRPGGTGPAGNQVATPTPSGFIGRYQILEKIGEGGMGSLYLARDPAIDRLVAIKLLRRGFDTEALRERFAREARAAGRLRHPNIVTIFDVGEHDGDPFIAMEFLAGETLGELIRHGAGLSLARRLKLLEELCDGLAYAHRAGLVHRDIKPANLMVDAEGVLKILDFGIVRVGESGMTQAGVLVGTINYMSPEQVLGTGVDHRSDIFAVGLVAYELLSGRQAFVGTMKDGLLRRIPNAEIDPLASVVPGLDLEVIAIVERALQKDAADRYQELARMRNDLARVRQRIGAEEERAAVEAASASAETALIAEEVTAPGVPVEPARSSGPGSGAGVIADAERALAEGNFRVALTMAGRAAAMDPNDRNPGNIVARAETALLERGRTYQSSQPVTPRSGGEIAPLAALPAPGSAVPSTGVPQRGNYVAVAVAVIALLVAAFAVWSQVGRPDERAEAPAGATEQAAAAPAGPTQPPPVSSPPAANPPAVEAETARGAQPQDPATASPPDRGSARSAEPRDDAKGGSGTAADRRRQANAERARPQTSTPAQPEPAERSKEPERTTPPVPGLPVQEKVSPPSTLPGGLAPRPMAPPPPPAAPDKTPPKAPEPKTETPAPVPDPRAEAHAAIESVLRRYEAAWEALNFDALARVWDMTDASGVRSSMRGMRTYAMDVKVQQIEVAADARTATAVCVVSHRFQPSVGSRQSETTMTTFTLEKRGDNWMITRLK